LNKLAGLFKRQDIPKIVLITAFFFIAGPMNKTVELLDGRLQDLDVLKWEWNVFITACYIGGFYLVIVIIRFLAPILKISLPAVSR